jgi:hypothetical protein
MCACVLHAQGKEVFNNYNFDTFELGLFNYGFAQASCTVDLPLSVSANCTNVGLALVGLSRRWVGPALYVLVGRGCCDAHPPPFAASLRLCVCMCVMVTMCACAPTHAA